MIPRERLAKQLREALESPAPRLLLERELVAGLLTLCEGGKSWVEFHAGRSVRAVSALDAPMIPVCSNCVFYESGRCREVPCTGARRRDGREVFFIPAEAEHPTAAPAMGEGAREIHYDFNDKPSTTT